LIKIENLSVVYDKGKAAETKALSDINVEIYPQEYIIFFGPSGCGKSTLLYVIAAMERATTGKVVIHGNDISKMKEREITSYRQNTIGMVFQQYNLIPSLNVLENVAIPQTFKKIGKKERSPKAQALLDRFGIGAFSERLPTELSGGQQQRVSIARSLVNDTPLILADEPTGNLDSKSSQNVLDILQELNQKDKKTIILVTHDPNQLQYAHRVFHMKDGKVVRQTINTQLPQQMDAATREKLTRSLSGLSSAIIDILSVYPELTESRLKAKALVNYLMSELDTRQLDRLERLVEDRILGKISKNDFHAALDDPLEKGGAGLNYQSAKKIWESVESLLSETDVIQKNIDATRKDHAVNDAIVQEIYSQLSDVLTAQPSEEQAKRCKELIAKRISGTIDKTGFFAGLDLAFSHGGVGLRREVAEDITRRTEMLLIKFKDFTE
ncbi:ABC transporter ATP-binding protein, partial [Candidatus Azambacteria bacterium]|nr:ABC transporter ATP-binding protein [Candidatus Azambacteria bacterium]